MNNNPINFKITKIREDLFSPHASQNDQDQHVSDTQCPLPGLFDVNPVMEDEVCKLIKQNLAIKTKSILPY